MDEIHDDEASLSFLEAFLAYPDKQTVKDCCAINTSQHAALNIPDILSPSLLNCRIEIPRKIESIFKSSKQINHIYTIIDDSKLLIKNMDDDTIIGSFYVMFYDENIESILNKSTNETNKRMIFIFGREAYLNNEKQKIKQIYKEIIDGNDQLNIKSTSEKKRKELLRYQVWNKWNIIFIETGDELNARLQSYMKALERIPTKIQKIPKYDETGKSNYMEQLILGIPGIGNAAAKCISNEFSTFKMLKDTLEGNPEMLAKLIIVNERGTHQRVLGNNIVKKLQAVFLSDKPEQPI